MKKSSTIFLQVVIVLIGIGALGLMLWEPQLEGVNANATNFEIYFQDPFLAYAYISSIAFFVVLYQAWKVLGYVRQNKTFSRVTVKALRTIKNSAIVLSILVVIAGVYIRTFHAADDDPVGFLVLCMVTTFISIVIATVAGMFARTLEKAVDMKSENELTV
jgi:hypothetical protein